MTKSQIVAKLEGKTITTADGVTHVVQDGEFTTSLGDVCKLEDLPIYHLRGFLKAAPEIEK